MNHAINHEAPRNAYVTGPIAMRDDVLAASLRLLDYGLQTTTRTYARPRDLDDLLAIVAEDLAAIEQADILIYLGTADQAHTIEALALGVPVVSYGEFVALAEVAA